MIVEYFNLNEQREDLVKSSDGNFTLKEIDNMITRRIISKILRIDIDHKFYEIHVDPETMLLFSEMSHFAPLTLEKYDSPNGSIGSMMGKVLFVHHNEYRYISLFNEMDEVARIYLIDRNVLRENRFKKLLDK